jgi:hypothetical protein
MMGAPTKPDKKPGLIGRGLNALDRGVKKVGGALSNFGHQFTTDVTKEKLKMNWHQAGKPSDSAQLSAWLVKQGVPQEVVNSVYSKMGIPVSPVGTPAPTATPSAQTQPVANKRSAYTNNPYAVASAPTATAADAETASSAETDTATSPADAETATATAPASAFGNMSRQLSARGQAQTSTGGATIATGRGVRHAASPLNPNQQAYPSATKPAVQPAAQAPAATAATTAAPGAFNAANVMKMPGMQGAKKTAPVQTPNFAGPRGYGAVKTSFKPPALTKQLQVAESLTWSKNFDPGMTLLKKMRK